MTRTYAGIGYRWTPPGVCSIMGNLAADFRRRGFLLRSGGRGNADKAFERGAAGQCGIFDPNGATPEALKLAEQFHPAWHACDNFARRAHGRNMFILLGRELCDPVDFVVCFTIDGRASGGTGQAMRAAEFYGIPVFNLHDPTALDRLLTHAARR